MFCIRKYLFSDFFSTVSHLPLAGAVADNVSVPSVPLSANSGRKSLCLRARARMMASGYK
jgi:hypothetical protein